MRFAGSFDPKDRVFITPERALLSPPSERVRSDVNLLSTLARAYSRVPDPPHIGIRRHSAPGGALFGRGRLAAGSSTRYPHFH